MILLNSDHACAPLQRNCLEAAKFHDFVTSLKVYESSRKFKKVQESSKVHDFQSFMSCEILWFSKLHESSWKFMKVHESLWKFMKVHESSWTSFFTATAFLRDPVVSLLSHNRFFCKLLFNVRCKTSCFRDATNCCHSDSLSRARDPNVFRCHKL